MTVTLGAVISGLLGALTAVIARSIRAVSHPQPSPGAAAGLGAVLAVIAYFMFLAAGMVIGLLTMSTRPDPVPALVAVAVGCVLYLAILGLASLIGPRFGMRPVKSPRERRTVEDLIEAKPRGGEPTRWLGGVGLAALPAYYGLQCIVTGKGEFGTTFFRNDVHGVAAVVMGFGWLAIGAFLHFHFFFGLSPRLAPYSETGKRIAIVVACIGLMAGVFGGMASMAREVP
jgi:hypothetical protein